METRLNGREKKPFIVIGACFILIIFTFFLSLNIGVMVVSSTSVLKTLVGLGTEQDKMVLFDFRLPRMILSMLIGAGLAVAGAILQGISQNGLADSGILGINAGAGLGVVLFVYFVGESFSTLGALSIWAMPAFALVGGLMSALLIYILAWKKGVHATNFILVGIGINALLGAILLIFQLKLDPHSFMKTVVWLSGSIWGTNWSFVWTLIPWIVIFIPLAFYKARELNVLYLGDEAATGLGAKVNAERSKLLFVSVALASACVAVGGGIAFLGLVSPHLARKLVGTNYQFVLPTAALLGALILLLADMIGRNLLTPTEIPVGIVVSCIGAPYLIYLLMKVK
ncbi:iron ABC transporter permease [Bacillaceae bacterium SAS-127]|nr:iron ABC transporter permease [Bacillaceae bacterium SAS-127]